ncbi:membrane hypothetical protein [[Clostridium] ultunense Esp]|nr:membrane hypothetical protein [[Clostridium] ultunense Esp]
MSTKILHAAFVLIISIPISYINFSAYLKGYQPNTVQILFSVAYVFIWGVYGFLLGRKGLQFVRFSTYYWGIGTLLLIVSGSFRLLIVAFPLLFILAGPLYGLRYFFGLPPGVALISINSLIVYAFSILGYWLGKRIRETTKNR